MSRTTIEEVLKCNYSFIAKADLEDGGWIIFYPDLPGVMSQADTFEEIGEMAEDALRTWVETQLAAGRPIPEPSDFELPAWNWALAGEQLKPTKQVAEQLGVSPRRVLALAANRGVGQRFGRSVMFSDADIDRMRPRPVGRPRTA